MRQHNIIQSVRRQPDIILYFLMKYDPASKKTPKYVETASVGHYPPMVKLIGRDGKISMFLIASEKTNLKEGAKAPPMRLQAKNKLNFTGLKNYFTADGELSGYAYGYPLRNATYSSEKIPNPFYGYRTDGFLFVIHDDGNLRNKEGSIVPSSIELIVLKDAKVLIEDYCQQLANGGFNKKLDLLRRQAREPIVLEDAKAMIPNYCQQLAFGGFDEKVGFVEGTSPIML